MNFFVFYGLVVVFLVLSPYLRYLRKKSLLPHLYPWLTDGLWGVWGYASLVSVSFILGILITNLTRSLFIVYSLMIFAFPFGFVPELGKCLLNGFDSYHAECDVFPGAFTKIFFLNACLYFLIAVVVGKIIRKLKRS